MCTPRQGREGESVVEKMFANPVSGLQHAIRRKAADAQAAAPETWIGPGEGAVRFVNGLV